MEPDRSTRLSHFPGVEVGHWTCPKGGTGCTAILLDRLCPASAHVGGGAPGTQETDLLKPGMLVGAVDAIMLSGGSAFGLDTAGGARKYLAEQGRGYKAGGYNIPIVPAAVIFDLPKSGGEKPGADEGYMACKAGQNPTEKEGRIGVGAGATVGKYLGRKKAAPGGLASRMITVEGISIGAIVVANCYGSVWDPATNTMIAGPEDDSGNPLDYLGSTPVKPEFGATALGVIVTDARLDQAGAMRVAQMAHDGWARCVRPSHTPYDGDVIFVVSTGEKESELTWLGAQGAWLMERTTVAAVSLR